MGQYTYAKNTKVVQQMTLLVVGGVEGGQREEVVIVLVCAVCSSSFWVAYQILLRQLSEKQNYVSKYAGKQTTLTWSTRPEFPSPILHCRIVPWCVDKIFWSWAYCYDPGPQFSFSGPPILFPRHSLPSNPLSVTCHQVTPSQGVPCILLDCHVTLKAYWLFHSFIVLHHQPLLQSSDSLLRILYLALTHTIHHYCGSPIILLFSQLGVGTSHLYIRATISLELGLKPNLVFNPRLIASPASLLRVPLYP